MKYQDILPYIEQGLVTERVHPTHPNVRLFNYTEECQFLQKWDDVTMKCRGLIMDVDSDKLLSNPLPKFFNYSEYVSAGKVIPSEIPVVLEKLDGSLGVLYWLDGTPHIATRGSFTSDQATFATHLIRQKKYADLINSLDKTATYLFEIIYPANRIVIPYDFSDIVLLSIRGIDDTWEELPDSTYGFRTPAQYEYTSPEKLKALNISNKEGFVLFYHKSRLRLKIKFDEYVSMHKVVTGLSEIGIWELLMTKGIDTPASELIEGVPDEFFKWVEGTIATLRHEYNVILNEASAITKTARTFDTRQEQAKYIMNATKYSGLCFALLDDKDITKAIFKMIRPFGKTLFNF